MAKWTGQVYSGELLDWGFDWSNVTPTDDSISDATWTCSPSLVVTRETLSDGVSVVWLTDFEAGTTYTATCEVLLIPSQRVLNQSIVIQCLDSGSGGGVTVVDAEWSDGDAMTWADDETWVWLE